MLCHSYAIPSHAMPCHGVLCSVRVNRSEFVQELLRKRRCGRLLAPTGIGYREILSESPPPCIRMGPWRLALDFRLQLGSNSGHSGTFGADLRATGQTAHQKGWMLLGGGGMAWNAACTFVLLRDTGFLSIPLVFQPRKAIFKTAPFREAKIARKLPSAEN